MRGGGLCSGTHLLIPKPQLRTSKRPLGACMFLKFHSSSHSSLISAAQSLFTTIGNMALDPVSALSVAAAAIQFVQFSSHIVSKGRHIYNSSNGTIEDNDVTETVTLRLKELTQQLGKPRKSPINLNTPESDDMKKHQKQIKQICEECTNLSKTLLSRLQTLRVPAASEHRKWKSFRHALKSVWSKGEIDQMARRLRHLREELDSHIMFILRYVDCFGISSNPNDHNITINRIFQGNDERYGNQHGWSPPITR